MSTKIATHFNSSVSIHDYIYINKTTQIAWQERMQSRSELFLIQVHLYILKTNTEHKKDSMIENSTWPGKGTNQINHNRIEIITGDPDNRINATHDYNIHIADNTHFAHHSYIDASLASHLQAHILLTFCPSEAMDKD